MDRVTSSVSAVFDGREREGWERGGGGDGGVH